MVLFTATMAAAMTSMQDKNNEKLIEEILKRHGVDTSKSAAASSPDQALKNVSDKAGLYAELMQFAEQHSTTPMRVAVRGELKGVDIQGDRATGKTTGDDGKESTITFVKQGGSWYLKMDKP